MAASAYAISSSKAQRRGRPNAVDAEAKNAVIRAAALEVFASKGFDGASIVEIAKLAGVTRRTLYARYRDKQALLLDAVKGVIDERLQHYELSAMASAEEALLAIAGDITVRSPSAPLLMRIIIAEGSNFSHEEVPLGRAGRDHLLEQLEGVFAELIAKGMLPPANAAQAAVLFTDMVLASGIMSLLTFAPDGTVEDLLAPRVAFFCAGFASWARRTGQVDPMSEAKAADDPPGDFQHGE